MNSTVISSHTYHDYYQSCHLSTSSRLVGGRGRNIVVGNTEVVVTTFDFQPIHLLNCNQPGDKLSLLDNASNLVVGCIVQKRYSSLVCIRIGKKNNRKMLEIPTLLSCKQEMIFYNQFLTTFQLQMRKISTGCILFRCGCQMDRSCQNQIFFMLKIQRDRKRLFLRLGARASDIFSQSLLTTYNCSFSFYISHTNCDTKKINVLLTELLH